MRLLIVVFVLLFGVWISLIQLTFIFVTKLLIETVCFGGSFSYVYVGEATYSVPINSQYT